jgi:PAS domain S-box-containing protein
MLESDSFEEESSSFNCAANSYSAFLISNEAESTLQKDCDRLKLCADLIDIGLWDYDPIAQTSSWNEHCGKMLGVDNLGDAVNQMTPLNVIHPEDKLRVGHALHSALTQQTHYDIEFRVVQESGDVRWLHSKAQVYHNRNGQAIWMTGILIDVSDRKSRSAQFDERPTATTVLAEPPEESLAAALQEKEVLLKELHHRTKNNLQIISSLLRMQSRRLNQTEIQMQFQEAQNRVQAMALIHEQLYQTSNFSQLNFGS